MDVIKAMLARRSTRDFLPDPIAKDTLLNILENATHAPNGGNGQCWEIFVAGGAVMENIRQAYADRFAKDVPGKMEIAGTPPPQQTPAMQARMAQLQAERAKLFNTTPQDPVYSRGNRERGARFYGAPAIIVLCMPKSLSTFAVYDIGLLSQNICLAAENAGLGTLIASGIVNQPDILRKELGIPDDLVIVEGIAMGYANKKATINTYRSSRRPISEVVRLKGF